MDLQAKYQAIILQLKNNQRPRIKLSEGDIESLITLGNAWSKTEVLFHQENWETWLCVINYSADFHKQVVPILLNLLLFSSSTQVTIYALTALQKHLFAESQRSGERIPMEAINVLKKLLGHPDRDVLEWTLRTVEQLGTQSILLKAEVLKVKPKGVIIRKKTRHCLEIIQLIQARWPKFSQSQ